MKQRWKIHTPKVVILKNIDRRKKKHKKSSNETENIYVVCLLSVGTEKLRKQKRFMFVRIILLMKCNISIVLCLSISRSHLTFLFHCLAHIKFDIFVCALFFFSFHFLVFMLFCCISHCSCIYRFCFLL